MSGVLPRMYRFPRISLDGTMTLDRYGKHMNLGADETAAEVTRFIEKHGG